MKGQSKLLGLGRTGRVYLGDLRSLNPISRTFGQDRGTPIRRYYIERFMESKRHLLRRRVLEVGDARYSKMLCTPETKIDVLDPDPTSTVATIAGDLVTGVGVPSNQFDAIILTQVLHVLPDMTAAVRTGARALTPGGSLLAILPCISQISRFDMERWGDFWRVTDRGARVLFEAAFAPTQIEITSYGNVLTAIASLTGLAAEELRPEELETNDPDFEVLIAVHARKLA